MRHLLGSTVGTEASIGREQRVERCDHRALRRARRKRADEVVERPRHVVGGGKACARHPQDAELPIVGQRLAAADREHVFRRQRDADDGERLVTAVDQCPQRVARNEPVPHGEALADDHLVVPAVLGPAAGAQVQAVQQRQTAIGQRDHPPHRRRGGAGHVERHVVHDPQLDGGQAGDRLDAWRERERRALDAGEHVGEVRLDVERLLRAPQRVVGGERGDQRRDPARDDQRDRHRLRLHLREVAHELAVDRFHQAISAAVSRCALTSTPAMRPSASRNTRSAMPAIAALCVITTAVVPSSRLMRAITSSTTLPVA